MPNTFWQDFTIADHFGVNAIQNTFNRAFKEWKSNYKMLTEFIIVLNHKIWQYYEAGNEPYAKLYDRLWKQADAYACENLKGEELSYFLEVTD